jgi:hypothetical protein
MRPLFENKRLTVLLAVLALGALTVLAISLNQVPFREAQHFSHSEADDPQFTTVNVAQIWAEVPIWKQLFFWLFLLLLVILVGLLLSPEMRWRMFVIFIRVVVTFWALYILFTRYGDRLFGGPGARNSRDLQDGGATSPMPVFEPPQITPAFSYLISFVVAVLFLAVVWGIYRGWKKYLLLSTRKPLDEIAQIARSSLDDLSSGINSSDVIINCYLRMSNAVSSKRQLYREIAMTPREFAARLEQAGLPGEAVTRLTRLFEGVRYGDRKSAPKDVNEAVSCLKTILHYCGEPV